MSHSTPKFFRALIALTATLCLAVGVLVTAPLTAKAAQTYTCGDFAITGDDLAGIACANSVLTINSGGPYTITMNGAQTTTTSQIVVAAGADVDLSIDGLSVQPADGNSITVNSGAKLNLTVLGNNTFDAQYGSGIYVPEGASLTVTDASTGILVATGGTYCAGIGGCAWIGSTNAGTITIDGGQITAGSRNFAAGIGGGAGGKGGTITINDGQIIASGGPQGAGIGSGQQGNGGTITINGGRVDATGGQHSAGVGGGHTGSSDSITINGGQINATGGQFGAGIGGGAAGVGGRITINGGQIIANGGDYSAGIGGGEQGAGGNITITGGTIVCTPAGNYDPGMGNGTNYTGPAIPTVTIDGGSVLLDTFGTPISGTQPKNSAGTSVYYVDILVESGTILDRPVLQGDFGIVQLGSVPDAKNGIYGIKDVQTGRSGNLDFWLPSTAGETFPMWASFEGSSDRYVSYPGDEEIGTGFNGINLMSFAGVKEASGDIGVTPLIQTYTGSAHIPADPRLTGNLAGGSCGTGWKAVDAGGAVNVGTYDFYIDCSLGNYAGRAWTTVTINPAQAVVSVWPEVGSITYGQTLGDAVITDTDSSGRIPQAGHFAFDDTTVKPAVSDSEKTEYPLVFIPDSANYTTSASQGMTVKVEPRDLIDATDTTVLTTGDCEYIYNGAQQSLDPKCLIVKFPSEPALDYKTDYTFSAAETTGTTATLYHFSAEAISDSNYTGNRPYLIFEIYAADYTATLPTELNLTRGSGVSALPTAPVTTGVTPPGAAAAETVPGNLSWYTETAFTDEVVDSDLNGLTTAASVILHWKFEPTSTNYAGSKTGSTVFTIVDAASQTVTFDSNPPTLKTLVDSPFTVTATSSGSGTISYGSSNSNVATVNASTGEVTLVGVGDVTITASAAYVPGAYEPASESYTFKVNRAAGPTVNGFWTSYTSPSYGGTGRQVSVTYRGGFTEETAGLITVSYALDGVVVASPMDAGADAGVYDILVRTAGGTLYEPVSDLKVETLYIYPATYTVSVPDGNIKHGVGISALPTVPQTVGATINSIAETVSGTLSWFSDSDRQVPVVDSDLGTLNVAETKTLYWSFVATDPNYVSAVQTGSTVFTITAVEPQTVTFTDNTSAVTKNFGDPAFTLAATSSGSGEITYASTNPGIASVDPRTGEVSIHTVGTATITATAAFVAGLFEEGAVSYTLTVLKADTPTIPSAPVTAETTPTSISVEPVDGAEYSLDGITWQSSPTFSDLKPATEYTIYIRIAETDTHEASPASVALTVTTPGETPSAVWDESDNSHELETDVPLLFIVQKDFPLFDTALVDGAELDPDDYEVRSGSTEITLLASFLNTLAVGEHTLEVRFTDGSKVVSSFFVTPAQIVPGNKPPAEPVDPPVNALPDGGSLGDANGAAGIASLILALTGAGVLTLRRRA